MLLCLFGWHKRRYVGKWFMAFWGPRAKERAMYKREWFCARIGCPAFGETCRSMFVQEVDDLNEQIEKEKKG